VIRPELTAAHFTDLDCEALLRAGDTLASWAMSFTAQEVQDGRWCRDLAADPVETLALLRLLVTDAAAAIKSARACMDEATCAALVRCLDEQEAALWAF